MSTSHGHLHQHSRWSPESGRGRMAVACGGGAIAGIVLLAVAFALGLDQADSFTDNGLLLVWGLALVGGGAAALVTGVIAIVRHHDRSWSVLLATVLGLLVMLVILREAAQGL